MLVRTIHDKGRQRSGARANLRTWTGNGDTINCSTKYIVAAVRARMIAEGVQVGNQKCASLAINTMTGSSQAECLATQVTLRMQSEGVITGDNECAVRAYNTFTGDWIDLEPVYTFEELVIKAFKIRVQFDEGVFEAESCLYTTITKLISI